MMGRGGHFTQNRSVGAPGMVCILSEWSFSNFLELSAVSGCLALHMGWLAMLLRYQSASGMSQARFCNHVGLCLLRWSHAAVFQTAVMEIPRDSLGKGSLLTYPGLRGSVSNLISWNCSKYITQVEIGYL